MSFHPPGEGMVQRLYLPAGSVGPASVRSPLVSSTVAWFAPVQATVLETSGDLTVAGTTLPAGKYSLWTIPSPGSWKLIVNRNTGQWGTDYDAQYDLARLEMMVESLPQPVEQFTIAIEPKGKRGVLKLEWEKTRASIPFSAK